MSEPSRILNVAEQTIGERASDRDVENERSMKGTVAAFNAMTGHSLTEAEGWAFMSLLKMKRSFTGSTYRDDDFVDEAAYTALRAEARQTECKKPANLAEALAMEAQAERARALMKDHQERMKNSFPTIT